MKKYLLPFLLFAYPAVGHEATTGWSYPLYCCSNQDCHQINDADVKEGREGYTLASTGEIVPYLDRRVKDSPDGLFHVCQQAGDFDNGRILCLFVPPRSF